MTRLTHTPGNHAYWLTDPDTGTKQRLPSVTTLLNMLAKPAFVRWAANQAASYAADNWEELAHLPISERIKLIGSAAEQNRQTAAATGTQIHQWAEQLITTGEVSGIPERFLSAVEGFARWWRASGWTKLHSEALVWSEEDEYGGAAYAGKLDLLALDRDGRVILADLKTGAGIWPEMAMQIAAYANADNIVIDGRDQPMLLIDRLCILHIRPEATTLHELADDQRRAAEDRWQILRALRDSPEPVLQMKETA